MFLYPQHIYQAIYDLNRAKTLERNIQFVCSFTLRAQRTVFRTVFIDGFLRIFFKHCLTFFIFFRIFSIHLHIFSPCEKLVVSGHPLQPCVYEQGFLLDTTTLKQCDCALQNDRIYGIVHVRDIQIFQHCSEVFRSKWPFFFFIIFLTPQKRSNLEVCLAASESSSNIAIWIVANSIIFRFLDHKLHNKS